MIISPLEWKAAELASNEWHSNDPDQNIAKGMKQQAMYPHEDEKKWEAEIIDRKERENGDRGSAVSQ